MTIRRKRNIVFIFLIAYAVWPLAHFGLVQWLDISPWKLAGWAMYTTPPRHISVLIYRVEDGERSTRLELRPPSERARFDLQRAYDRFGIKRVYFNRLVEPDGFAREIFRYFPDVDEIEIVIHRFSIDRKTGHVTKVVEDTVYRYSREQFEEP